MRRRGQVGSESVGRGGFVAAGIVLLALLVAGPGRADWSVYIAPGLGISRAIVDSDGAEQTTPIRFRGDDNDSSPALALAVGLEVPMDELVPREWLLDVRLPRWPLRVELEASGLREYEFRTDTTGQDDFFSEINVTTTFVNFWVDIPLVSVYRPVQYVFGLGRQPRVRRWLEPASLYLGGGVGFSAVEVDSTSNVLSAKDDLIDFAGNIGAGVNYDLTDRVALSLGYRFVGLPDQTFDLEGGAGNNDEVDYQNWEVHEFRFAVKIRVWEFRSPWR